MRKIFLASALLFVFCSAQAQQIHNLTLDKSIDIAKKQSFEMLRLEQDIKISEFNLKSATSALKTHIDLDLTTPQFSEEIRSREDTSGVSYYSVKQLNYAGGLTISQPLPTDGQIFINNRVSNLKEFDANRRSSNVRTRIGLEQPLDAFYGYNNIRSSLKRAKLSYEQTTKSLKRSDLDLVYKVSNAYYILLSGQKSTEIAKINLDRQKEVYEISQKKFAAGIIPEVEALQMEVDLASAQNSYEMAVLNQSSAINSFKQEIGISLQDSIILNSDLGDYKVFLVDVNKAVEHALKNRLEIREQEIQLELQNLSIKQQKANGMVKASVSAYVEKAGVDQGIGTDFTKSISNAYTDFGDRPSNFGVGLTIRVPVLDWGENRAKVRAAEAQKKKIEYNKEELERQIEIGVRDLVAQINSNLKRLQILEKSVLIAEKSFEITLDRYTEGDINSETFAQERNRLNSTYQSHLDAYMKYQLSLSDLKRKTFYDFENDRPIE
mgnify:CR=1 FL=1